MKYCLFNWYNKTLQVRNTQLRLIRYIRHWNFKHPNQPISRNEIKEVERIEYRRLNIVKRLIVWLIAFIGIESPFTEGLEQSGDMSDPITEYKAYRNKHI